MFLYFFIGDGISPLTVDSKAQSFAVRKASWNPSKLAGKLDGGSDTMGNLGKASGKAGGGLGWRWGLGDGARACGSARCQLLRDPGGNDFIPRFEYPRASLVSWEQSCLVSRASAVRSQSRRSRLDCLGCGCSPSSRKAPSPAPA